MKKDDQEITLLESDITSNKDLKKNNFKTTLTYNFRLLKFFKNKYSG